MEIKDASALSGLSADTIRFYERRGVLPSPLRRENGYRDYSPAHIATLRLVAGLRHIELSLDQMQQLARIAHDATCRDLRAALGESVRTTLNQVDERIRMLRHTRGHLAGLIEGLDQMSADDTLIPGATPCRCIDLVADEVERDR